MKTSAMHTMMTSMIRMTLLIGMCTIGVMRTAPAQSLAMQGGNITLTIATATPGSEPTPIVDAATKIRFKGDVSLPTKITVQTVCPGQKFNLTVEATAVGDGTAAPAVSLTNGMLATDIVTNIGVASKKNFTLTLQYTASATFAQGNSIELGDDAHTVTYSLVAQ